MTSEGMQKEIDRLKAEVAHMRVMLERIEGNDPEANRMDADKLANAGLRLGRSAKPNPACACHACNPDAWWMVVCSTCGNKRCPHATNHAHACTNSNAPGQVGSVFGPSPEDFANELFRENGGKLA